MIRREDLQNTDFSDVVTGKHLEPVHPGEVLQEDFIEPLALEQNELARQTGIPVSRIHAIVTRELAVNADTALRLGRYFGTTPEFWMNLQSSYDLDMARHSLGKRLFDEVSPRAA